MKKLSKLKALILSTSLTAMLLPTTFTIQTEAYADIIVSPYNLYMSDTTLVTSNRTYNATTFNGNYMTPSATGAYNAGKYLTVQSTESNINVSLKNLDYGTYDVYCYMPGGTLTASNFTTSCSLDLLGIQNLSINTFNMSAQQRGAFVLIAQDYTIRDEFHLKYTNHAAGALRADVIKLVPKTKIIVDANRIDNVKIGGQCVVATGIEGLAVGGTCDVGYTYVNSANIAEDTTKTKYQWYKSLLQNGEYIAINGATNSKLAITDEYAGYYVKIGVKATTTDGVQYREYFSNPQQVKYKLTFVDEFDYVAVNGEDPEFTSRGWKSDRSVRVLGTPTTYCARVPENTEVKDGKLRLITRKEHLDKYNSLDIAGNPHTWTTGNVQTSKLFGPYGVYDCSYKFAPATGLNQSFWAMTQGKTSDQDGMLEIDFDEGHYPRQMATNLHRMIGTTRTTNSISYNPLGSATTDPTFADNFNRFTGMLKPNNPSYAWDAAQNGDTYQIFFNNNNVRRTNSLQYKPAGVSIYCSIAVYPGTFTGGQLVDTQANNSVMEVDYVRYYDYLGATIADIERALINAQQLITGATVGTANGNYSQDSINQLNSAILVAQGVITNNPSQEELNSALASLNTATNNFLSSVIGGYVIHVQSLSFDQTTVSLPIEFSKKLTVAINPVNASNQAVTFSSSDVNIAKVDANGVVTAVAKGTAIITATALDGNIKAQSTITVTDLPSGQVLYPVTGGKLVFDTTSKVIVGYTGLPTDITIPSSINGVEVNSIAINTFKGLNTLKTLVIERGITQIGDWSFNECTSLERITLPNSVITINTGAFLGCSALTEITIPESVISMEGSSFAGCGKLIKATFLGNAPANFENQVFTNSDKFTIYYYEGATGFDTPIIKSYKTYAITNNPINVMHYTNGTNEVFDIILSSEYQVSNTVIIAIYDKDGRFLYTKCAPSSSQMLITFEKPVGATKAKIMLWNGFNEIKLLTKYVEIDI